MQCSICRRIQDEEYEKRSQQCTNYQDSRNLSLHHIPPLLKMLFVSLTIHTLPLETVTTDNVQVPSHLLVGEGHRSAWHIRVPSNEIILIFL
ncbi:hypothetical protein BYT27DRAFT_6462278 [Phlegmacium glaucopus]|nr:hypothetical protein BYT27DRAFT_6462278 [Phlegmacium glaucopus]